jgi:hypothetical protein
VVSVCSCHSFLFPLAHDAQRMEALTPCVTHCLWPLIALIWVRAGGAINCPLAAHPAGGHVVVATFVVGDELLACHTQPVGGTSNEKMRK